MALVVLSCPATPQAQEVNEEDTPFSDTDDVWRFRDLFTGEKVVFYGQLSPALVNYDDGGETRTYAPVGNSNKTSRLGFRWHLDSFGDWSPIARVEVGLTARPSKEVNLADPGSNSWSLGDGVLRKLELIARNPRFGAFSLGQGSMATDNITEVDYSGTRLAAYSGVAQVAASQFLRHSDGRLSNLQVGDFIDNFDGYNITGTYPDGSRKTRLRYDTPNYKGLIVSAALGNEVLRDDGGANADLAMTYEGEFGDYKLAAGAGYSWQSDSRVLSGSASLLHEPTGFNLTAALGGERDGGSFTYLKAGMQRSIWSVGRTAVSLDLYRGRDIQSAGSLATSYGLALTQTFEAHGVTAYALVRSYDFKQPGFSYRNATVAMAGLNWKF